MTEPLHVYPDFEGMIEDLHLVQDPSSKFYQNPDGNLIALHRTLAANDASLRPSSEGTYGSGIYVGNTPNVLASFSKISYMRSLVAVELPCEDDEVKLLSHSKFDRETFDRNNRLAGDKVKLLVWKPPFGNTIGCVAMRGITGVPKSPRWGLWIDNSNPVKPFAKIV